MPVAATVWERANAVADVHCYPILLWACKVKDGVFDAGAAVFLAAMPVMAWDSLPVRNAVVAVGRWGYAKLVKGMGVWKCGENV